jgi:hypothetical protein
MKPASVTDKVVVEGDEGFGFGVENAEEVVGFAEGEFGVAECGHGRERRGLCIGERANGFVAFEKGVNGGQVDVKISGRGAGMETEPVDDVAFNGLSQVVNGVGAVGESKVDECRGAGDGFVGPEDIGGV